MHSEQAHRPPHLHEWPIVGSTFEYNNHRLAFYRRIIHECGGTASLRLGPLSVMICSSLDAIHDILVAHPEQFGLSNVVKHAFIPLATNGLLTSEGSTYRQQRKLMAPSFQPGTIPGYAQHIATYGEQAQNRWKEHEVINIGEEMTRVSMRSIGKILFDADILDEAADLGTLLQNVLDIINVRLSYPLPGKLSDLLPGSGAVRRQEPRLTHLIQDMIEHRRTNTLVNNDLLSALLHAEADGERMQDQQIQDEVRTILFAGHETIAQTLAWAWYLLSRHPEIYTCMQQEIDASLQGRTPTYADLASLPYTLQVLKETMRLYPSIHAIVRVARKTTHIGEFYVRKGTTILISPFVNHHRPDYFPQPERFDPKRFSLEEEKKLPRYAFLPFGAGARRCVGSHLALMEGQLLLATLAQRVTFALVSQQTEPKPKVTLRPADAIQMVVKRR